MAVLKAKAAKVVPFVIPLMQRELISPLVSTRVSGDQFKGAKGDTVTLEVKELKAVARDYDFRGRTAPIVLDDISGGYQMPIRISKHVISATGLEDEHMTLDEVSLAREVVAPQAKALADDLENKTVAAFRALSFKHTLAVAATDDPLNVSLEARRLMDSDKVAPRAGRAFLVGSDVAAAWLASDRLSKFDSTGQSGTPALRDAVIGRLAGSPVIEHNGLNANEAYYIHNTSLIVASVAPVRPQGATQSAVVTSNGLAATWVQDYDMNYVRDRSLVHFFCGTNEFRDERNADGSWIYETTDMDADEAAERGLDYGSFAPNGTRKNVRAVKITVSGTGSVLAF